MLLLKQWPGRDWVPTAERESHWASRCFSMALFPFFVMFKEHSALPSIFLSFFSVIIYYLKIYCIKFWPIGSLQNKWYLFNRSYILMEIHHCFENLCLKSLCLSSPLFGKYFLFIIFLFCKVNQTLTGKKRSRHSKIYHI